MSQVITVSDLQQYMVGKTVDPGLASRIVDGINQWVETQTGRIWGDTKQVTERYDWRQNVWLRKTDVVSIDAVTVGLPGQTPTALAASNYFVDDLGRLSFYYASLPARMPRSLSVQYTYGREDVPDDLKMAALGIAAGMYTWASNENRDVAAVSVGSYSVQYQRRARGQSDNKTSADASWGVIDSYKLRRL